MTAEHDEPEVATNFVADLIEAEQQAGAVATVTTRFPPEPNGYLHLGHAKAIWLAFGVAKRFGGVCNLRFDDTNPAAEEAEFVESIRTDVAWLGYAVADERVFFASDYFEQLYAWAEQLVEDGKAYVDSQTAEEIRDNRGNFYKPGVDSPFRDRSVADNLDLLRRMKAGEFKDGQHVLRAKIDMAHGNINLRDPLMYRILKERHHRTGDTWCIYPMYDYAHGQSDAIERITHSLCTLEFEDHRPLYEWFVDNVAVPAKPRQIEFAKLHFTFTVLSKRKLKQLVAENVVDGWDDPRMPTISGVRRRGYPPEVLAELCERVGVAKREGIVDVALLDHILRENLNRTSPRAMAVLRPLKLIIDNLPEGEVMHFDVPNNPGDEAAGTRSVAFTRELWVERDDFREEAPKKWFRLAPGKEVRLRSACLVRCTEVIKDPETGEVIQLHCTWDPESKGGRSPDGRKVRGTLHWVSAQHAVEGTVRLFDRLFSTENPTDVPEGGSFLDNINPDSLEVLTGCKLEASLGERATEHGWRCQFERLGYFCVDLDSAQGAPVFNRTIGLRDSWAKLEKKNA
ncbi:MAG: glutamine--tRNA ligase/YqeY domain fusion protein [Nannocystaceae bacterium]|nr:glutamine--tRNA ligase/YqeY domain fusion protein [Nannocystaceae bacterium]